MKGVRTVLVDWTKDDSGRWVMKERPDSEQVFDADMVSIERVLCGVCNMES